MLFHKMFRKPYLDADTGTEIGSGTGVEATSTEVQGTEVVATDNQTTGTEQNTEPQKIKVKYNHQEMELPYEEAVQHIQKGMNYDKAIEKARQEARDSYIADQGYEWNGKTITTEAEYKTALAESQRIEAMQADGIDPSVIEKYVQEDPRIKAAREKEQQQALSEKSNADAQEFFKLFKKENGRVFDADTDVLPPEVIDMANKGKPLADAYTYHLNDKLKAKIAELEGKKAAEETNQANANSSTGSVTGNGSGDNGFISFEAFEANKNNQRWVVDNLSKISESRSKW